MQVASPYGGAQEYTIDIPAGAVDGQRLRIADADGQDGDLLITLRVKDSKRYRLSGADIETDLPISPWEAALGADVSMPTPGRPGHRARSARLVHGQAAPPARAGDAAQGTAGRPVCAGEGRRSPHSQQEGEGAVRTAPRRIVV